MDELKNIKDTRIKLIIAGVLPGTTEFQDKNGKRYDVTHYKVTGSQNKTNEGKKTWNGFLKAYPQLRVVDGVIYNKKYQYLVDEYHKNSPKFKEHDHIVFGKLMGYYPIDLESFDYRDVLLIQFIDGNGIDFLSYWKFIDKNLVREYNLLKKMRAIDKSINLKISIVQP